MGENLFGISSFRRSRWCFILKNRTPQYFNSKIKIVKMKVYKASLRHEASMLLAHFVLSISLYIKCFYWEDSIGSDSEMFGIMCLVLPLSVICIFFLKRTSNSRILEFTIGLIPLAISAFLFWLAFWEESTFVPIHEFFPMFLSSAIAIFIIYPISIFYKNYKMKILSNDINT